MFESVCSAMHLPDVTRHGVSAVGNGESRPRSQPVPWAAQVGASCLLCCSRGKPAAEGRWEQGAGWSLQAGRGGEQWAENLWS